MPRCNGPTRSWLAKLAGWLDGWAGLETRMVGGGGWGATRVLSNARIIYEEAEGPFTSLHFISFLYHFASFPFRIAAFFAICL